MRIAVDSHEVPPYWKMMETVEDPAAVPVLPVSGPASSRVATSCRDRTRPLACHRAIYTNQGRRLGAHRGETPACRCQHSRHEQTYRCSLRQRDRLTRRPESELRAHVSPDAAPSRVVHPVRPRLALTHPMSLMLKGHQCWKNSQNSLFAHGPSALAQQGLLPHSIPEQNYLKTRLRYEGRLVPMRHCGPSRCDRARCEWHGFHQLVWKPPRCIPSCPSCQMQAASHHLRTPRKTHRGHAPPKWPCNGPWLCSRFLSACQR